MKLFYTERKEAADRCRERGDKIGRQRENKLCQSETFDYKL